MTRAPVPGRNTPPCHQLPRGNIPRPANALRPTAAQRILPTSMASSFSDPRTRTGSRKARIRATRASGASRNASDPYWKRPSPTRQSRAWNVSSRDRFGFLNSAVAAATFAQRRRASCCGACRAMTRTEERADRARYRPRRPRMAGTPLRHDVRDGTRTPALLPPSDGRSSPCLDNLLQTAALTRFLRERRT